MTLTYDRQGAAAALIQHYTRVKEARSDGTGGLPTLIHTFKGVCLGIGAANGMNGEVLRNITKAYVDSSPLEYTRARESDEMWYAYCDGLADKIEGWLT